MIWNRANQRDWSNFHPMRSLILLFLVVAGFTTSLFQLPSPSIPKLVKPSSCIYRGFSRFDLYRITFFWQPAVCIHKIYKAKTHCQTDVAHPSRWMIHRVQPFRIERILGKKFSFPICCPTRKQFRWKSFSKDLKNDIYEFWRDLNGNGTRYYANTKTYQQEFNTFGSCAIREPNIGSVTNYFSKSIEFAKKFDIFGALQKFNITADNFKTYTKQEIVDALESELKATPIFGCFNVDNFSSPVLNEMSFFVTKDFVPLMNWPERLKNKFWTCSKNEYIIPVIGPEEIENNEPEIIRLEDYM